VVSFRPGAEARGVETVRYVFCTGNNIADNSTPKR
jgi:hypothetical protein